MDKNIFDERRRALEDAFFAKQDQALLAGLKKSHERESLRAACGIEDETLLDRLLEIGLGSEDLAALSLVPLIQVAWADGKVEERERRAILAAAEAAGIAKDSTAHQLLDGWMASNPGAQLYSTWRGFAQALAAQMRPEDRASLRADVTERARAVAQAAGGILGALAISNAERHAIEEIEKALG